MNVSDLFWWIGAAGVGKSGVLLVHWGCVCAAGGFVSCFTLVWALGGV